MGRKRVPGLIMRAGIWHIDKRIFGRRICQSTGTAQLEEAERHLARVMEETRQAQVYGVRPARTFEQAAAKFVLENQHKRSLGDDVEPAQGADALDRSRRPRQAPPGCPCSRGLSSGDAAGVAAGTINHGLQIVRRILNLAAGEWVDEQGLTWLHAAPKIKLLPNNDKRQPYPLDWDEQSRLFRELPDHLADMALFAVNTGCRDAEICSLRWDWEVAGAGTWHVGLHHSVAKRKERRRRLVVLNRVRARSIDARRGNRPGSRVHLPRADRSSRMLTSRLDTRPERCRSSTGRGFTI